MILTMHDTMKRLYSAADAIMRVTGQKAVADLLGESQQTVNNWENRGVSRDGRLKAQATFGCNATWIETGKGPMVAFAKPDKNIVRYEFLDVRVAWGSNAINDDHPVAIRSIEMPVEAARDSIGQVDDAVKIIQATGDSMEPTILPGDLLFVNTSKNKFSGDGVYLLFHGGVLLCKRLALAGSVVKVSSDNDLYETWEWGERLEDTRIIGKVLRALPMDMKEFIN